MPRGIVAGVSPKRRSTRQASELSIAIAEVLNAYVQRRDVSQMWLSHRTGFPQPNFTRWGIATRDEGKQPEKGLTVDELDVIAEHLGTSAASVLRDAKSIVTGSVPEETVRLRIVH